MPSALCLFPNIISRIIEKHLDDIVRVHTDGFIAKKKLDITTCFKIGNLALKGYWKNVKVPTRSLEKQKKDNYTKF